MRRASLLVCLGAVSVAALLLALRSAGARGGAEEGHASPSEAHGSGTLLETARWPAAARDEEVIERTQLEADGDERADPMETSSAGIVLRGSVRWAEGGEPLPDLRLVANGAGGARFSVVSDELGNFESEPVLVPGRLRFWLGEASGGSSVRHPKGLRLDVEVFLVPEGAGTFEVELQVLRPALLLNVDVRARANTPVQGAEVSLEVITSAGLAPGNPGRGVSPEHIIWRRKSDEIGRATFALYHIESIQSLGLFAVDRDGAGNAPPPASEHRIFEAPRWAGAEATERLVLEEGARLQVRVRDEAGAPLAGLWTRLEVGDEPLFAWLPRGGVTDEQGVRCFDGLPPRPFVVVAEGGGRQIRRQVELVRGLEHELELVLAEEQVPRLAVAGIVLDEDGAPLPRAHVTALYPWDSADLEARDTRPTDALGRFEFQSVPCERITVLLDGDLHGDEFTPERQTVAFGAQDLVFRRTRRIPMRELDLELVDAVTGQRLRDALVITVRSGTPSYEFVSVVGGLITQVIGEHPDVRLLVDAVGYRRRLVHPGELPRSEDERRLHRIELEPGFACSLEVQGAAGTGLAGAEVWDGSLLLGVTDRAGRLAIELSYWPGGPLLVEAPGHRPASWLPSDELGEPGPVVLRLERLE